MPTPHLSASPGDFAPDVLMPGDPVRARLIAERFLDAPRLVTDVRGVLGFTGTYEGRPLSVLASGMGVPSISIYATELAREYGVRRIVRVGTIGAIDPTLRLGDVVIATAAHTDSSALAGAVPGVSLAPAPDFDLCRAAASSAAASGASARFGPVFTSDSFYGQFPDRMGQLRALGTLGVEMEAAGLYAVGMRERIGTLAIMTVSDLPGAEMTSEERQATFEQMVTIAIDALGRNAR